MERPDQGSPLPSDPAGREDIIRDDDIRDDVALSGTALIAASAATRWGIYHAGLASARDPKYTVIPQRQRLDERAALKTKNLWKRTGWPARPRSSAPPACPPTSPRRDRGPARFRPRRSPG